jgi:hypothetical protein
LLKYRGSLINLTGFYFISTEIKKIENQIITISFNIILLINLRIKNKPLLLLQQQKTETMYKHIVTLLLIKEMKDKLQSERMLSHFKYELSEIKEVKENLFEVKIKVSDISDLFYIGAECTANFMVNATIN